MAGSATAPIVYSGAARKVQPLDWNAAWTGAANTYLTITSAAAIYLTQTTAAATYLTIASAAALYATILAPILVKTAAYTAAASDEIVICNSTSAFTVTLPTAVVGKSYTIKNVNTGIITVDAAGTDTIDGATTQALNQWSCMQIRCYATNTWGII